MQVIWANAFGNVSDNTFEHLLWPIMPYAHSIQAENGSYVCAFSLSLSILLLFLLSLALFGSLSVFVMLGVTHSVFHVYDEPAVLCRYGRFFFVSSLQGCCCCCIQTRKPNNIYFDTDKLYRWDCFICVCVKYMYYVHNQSTNTMILVFVFGGYVVYDRILSMHTHTAHVKNSVSFQIGSSIFFICFYTVNNHSSNQTKLRTFVFLLLAHCWLLLIW